MLHAYLYITKMRILTSLAYRFEVFTAIASNMILLVATIYIWHAAYSGIDAVESLALSDLVTYTVVSTLLSSLFVCNVQNTIYGKIRQGQIATDLYRPIPLLASYLADDLGGAISNLVNRMVPMLLFASLLFGVPWPDSWSSFLLTVPSALLSYAILWLLSAIVGLVAFWVMELGNLGMVKDTIVRIFSGSIVPLWFFPESVQTVSRFLPFQYTYQTPIGIYIGAIPLDQAFRDMGIQLVWIVVLCVLLQLYWKKTKTKTLIQGG